MGFVLSAYRRIQKCYVAPCKLVYVRNVCGYVYPIPNDPQMEADIHAYHCTAVSIFLLGYLMQTYANLNLYINKWKLFYPGLLRGIAEISLGCVCYEICEKMKGVSYTSFSRFLITVAQLLGYGFVIYCMHDLPGGKQFEFVFVPILAFCVTLSFSGQGIATGLFTSKVFTWLGKMSMIIYLNHMWVKDSINVFLPKSLGYWKLLVICLFCVFVASLICMFIMDGIMRWLNRHRSRIYRCFIKV